MGPEQYPGVRQQRELIAALHRPDVYPHPVVSVEVVETHISWVILTGQYAYKIKKAVDLGFLDFSTLQRRRHYCEEELRLNARWAPELYLGLEPIRGSRDRPLLGGEGEAIEYAVRMRQFPQEAQLDRQLDDGLLREDDLLRLAETIAANHEQARVIEYANDSESVGKVSAPILGNFSPVERAIDMGLLQRVHEWTTDTLKTLKPVLIQRRKDGCVRECHGDLHLSNLVRLHSGIVAFDCIEFSADLRNIDVLSDIAFLVMDLVARARQDLAFTFLNRYLERTGDYAGMSVFGLYFVYHSMIRAKVAAIRSAERTNDDDREKDVEAVKHYLAVAVRWIMAAGPRLFAMHGYSGSGKTWLSSQLLARLPAVRLRSDIERKRLSGLEETAVSDSPPGEGIYSKTKSDGVYARLFESAGVLLDAGFNVLIDAAFLRQVDRQGLVSLAGNKQTQYVIVAASAGDAELRRRLRRRGNRRDDGRGDGRAEVSEADTAVLDHQLRIADPLDEIETQRTVFIRTDEDTDADDMIKSLNRFW